MQVSSVSVPALPYEKACRDWRDATKGRTQVSGDVLAVTLSVSQFRNIMSSVAIHGYLLR